MAGPWRQPTSGEVVKRQLEIPSDTYKTADDIMADENSRMGLIKRTDKLFLNDFLIILIGDGISHRQGKVYSPKDKQPLYSKDKQWNILRKEAEQAIQKLRKYEATIKEAS